MNETRILVVDTNIRLKEIGMEDAEVIFNTINSEREYLGEWLPFVAQTQEIAYTRGYIESYLDSNQTDLTCAIYYQNRFAGLIGLKDTDRDNKRVEIGYWLSEAFQHKGIVTSACKTLINYAFDEMDMHRVQIKAATGNIKSQRIPERLGFTREGIERDGELHARGFVDLVTFSLLKTDR